MRTALLSIAVLASSALSAAAGNYSREVDLDAGNYRAFELLATCQSGGFTCINLSGVDLTVKSWNGNAFVDDAGKIAAKEAEDAAMTALEDALERLPGYGAQIQAASDLSGLKAVLKAMADDLATIIAP